MFVANRTVLQIVFIIIIVYNLDVMQHLDIQDLTVDVTLIWHYINRSTHVIIPIQSRLQPI